MDSKVNECTSSARNKVREGLYSDALLFYNVAKRRIERLLKSSDHLKSSEIEQLRRYYVEIEKEAEKCLQIVNVLQSFKRTAQLASKSNGNMSNYFPVKRITPDSSLLTIKKTKSAEIPTEPTSVGSDDFVPMSRRFHKTNKIPTLHSSKISVNKKMEVKKTSGTTKPAKDSVKDGRVGTEIRSNNDLTDIIEAEILEKNPLVQWNDVAGCFKAKELLKEAIILPTLIPKYFTGIRRPWKGILLVGPPGTGKTLLAKAVATECKSTFLSVSSATLTSKYHGESEKLVKAMFIVARKKTPSIIFLDEIDALCSRRGAANEHEVSRRIKSELLIQMDGLGAFNETISNVMVIGATNFPWDLDEALRRRLEKRVYIPLPDLEAREQLLILNLKNITLSGDVDTRDLAIRLDGYSGSDITNVCRDASMMSMRRKFSGLTMDEIVQIPEHELQLPTCQQDFIESICKISPSVSKKDTIKYEKWIEDFGSV